MEWELQECHCSFRYSMGHYYVLQKADDYRHSKTQSKWLPVRIVKLALIFRPRFAQISPREFYLFVQKK